MIKLTIIKTNPEWLEATWVEEITTQVEAEKEIQIETEVDGEVIITTEIAKELEDKVETSVLWCESYSGHTEHIQMLRNKALELETDLAEFEDLIKEVEEAFVYPIDKELEAEIIANKVQEARAYLESTKWYVERLNDPSSGKAIPDEVLIKRAEARKYISENQ